MIRKRILGLLICLAMITAMMPQFVLAETPETEEPSETQEMASEEVPAETGADEIAGAESPETAAENVPETTEATDTTDTGEIPDEEPDTKQADAKLLAAEAEEPVTEGESEDEFSVTLPTVYLHINGGQAEVDKMNESDNHSYHCKGTMDIIVPEGFKYVDSNAKLSSVTGLGMDIRGRGNTSWNADKKPYKIKLDNKTKILGMEKNKHWALIANAFDPTLMRNRITYWLGKEMGLEFTPSGYPVDVFMEGEYYGTYLLCETIRVDKNRVDIDELDESFTGGEALTGGYFVQFLQDAGAASTFSTKKGTDLQNVEPSFDPDDDGYENEAQMNYIRGYIQEAEDAIFEGETADDSTASGYRKLNYRDYIDIESAALYWLFQEFTLNSDAYTTGSSYFYKTRDKDGKAGKIFWGPLWDFDYAWDFGDTYEGSEDEVFLTETPWMTAMMTDRTKGGLPDTIRKDWPVMKAKLEYIVEPGGLLDQYKEEVRISEEYDIEKYGADDRFADYDEAVDNLRTWIKNRIGYVDENIDTLDEYSFKMTFMQDENDEHPVVFAYKKGGTNSWEIDEPEKEGYYFTGWYTKDGISFDGGEKDSDMTFYPRFVSEEDAVKADSIYFINDDIYIKLEDKSFRPQYDLLPDDALNRTVTWSSSDESVAGIGEGDTIELHKTGVTTITGTLPTGSAGSFRLHVVDEQSTFESANVSRPAVYMKPGDIRKVNAIIKPADAWNIAYFNCEENDVADVKNTGVIIAKTPGKIEAKVSVDYLDEGGFASTEVFFDIIVSDKDGSISTDTVTEGIKGNAIDLDKIAEDILSEEDRADLAGGADIKVWLEMKKLDGSEVPEADKQLLSDYLSDNNLTEGSYLDISLFRKIGDAVEALHKVSKPVRFAVTVPEELRATDADDSRTFLLLHVADGKVSVMSTGSGNELEAESSEFSTYMIAYSDDIVSEDIIDEDQPIAGGADYTGSAGSGHKNVKTGDSRNLLLWLSMMFISFAALAAMTIRMIKNRKQ